MGHKAADFDSIGSAAGICCIARAKGKRVRIVINQSMNLAENLVDLLSRSTEYRDVFISEQDAILEADSKSLLVVVDTSRPDKVESRTLLLSCTRVAVIDHHRRAAEYIENAALNFHEPYASSTAELVAEMMQYLLELPDIMKHEAEALLAGIVLDTKGFVINTGTRTFDAASFLRRAGADAAAVKRLLQSDMEIASAKFAIMQGAKMYREGIALAFSDESYSRISIAQAADDLLGVAGVGTSVAVAREGDVVFVSGRSIGGMNVQVVLEKLGGGGNHSTAGLQVPGGDVAQVVEDLKQAVDWYLK
jgi:c-di-AMP phosphodiesterase-like protein